MGDGRAVVPVAGTFLLRRGPTFGIPLFPAAMVESSNPLPDVPVAALQAALDRHVLLAIAGPDWRLIHVNSGYCELSGYERKTLLGRSLAANIPQPARELLAQGELWQGRLKQLNREGQDYWLQTTILPERNAAGMVRYVLAASDISDLIRTETRYQRLLESPEELLIRVDPAGRLIYVNEAFSRLFSRTAEFLVNRTLAELFAPEQRARLATALQTLAKPPYRTILELCCEAGDLPRWLHWELVAIRDTEGRTLEIQACGYDITQQKNMADELRGTEARYRLLMDQASDGIVLTDMQGQILEVNRKAVEMLGYSHDELFGLSLMDLHPREEYPRLRTAFRTLRQTGASLCEHALLAKDGRSIPVEISGTRVDYQGRTVALGIIRDLTQRREAETRRLYHLAYYDGLTGLPNRELFYDRLAQALALAERERHGVGLLVLDLDRFKHINDTLGHTTGDRLLMAVAARLLRVVREEDTVARLGGDEFTVILPVLPRAEAAGGVAAKIAEAFEAPFLIGDRQFYVSASIGISVYPDDGRSADSLIKNADTAMYRAKASGWTKYRFYSPEMSAHFVERLALEHDLRDALQRDELALVYQPQYSIGDRRVVGVEALIRWQHRKLGAVPPSRFIAMAEETGLIGEIGDWVLRTACTEAHSWGALLGTRRVAVNLSGWQLGQKGFEDQVGRILMETGLSAQSLELELTETVMMQNVAKAVSTLHALNGMGIQLAIDDFGTGYSSLSYLTQFSIDRLKIDRSFVRDVPWDRHDSTIASTIIAMAHALGLKVIAEGVETEDQFRFLQDQGCDEMQGFLLSPPVSGHRIVALLAAEAGRG